MLVTSINVFGQTSIDNEPGNNSVPGDSIALPVNNSANLSYGTDIDFIKVRTKKIGILSISVTGTNSFMRTRVTVINADGVSTEGFNDAPFSGGDVTIEILAQNIGLYYIKIQNNNGTNTSGYKLNISLDTSDIYEFNNSISSLSTISPFGISLNESSPTAINAQIRGYYYVSNGGNYGLGSLTLDYDIFKVTTGSKLGVLVMKIVSAPSNIKFRIEITAADGTTSLGFRDAVNNGDTLRFELLTQYAGNYYIKILNVNGNGIGAGSSATPYTLNMSLDTMGNEYNDNIVSLNSSPPIPVSMNELIPTSFNAKIRGYNYIGNGGVYSFGNLTADQDYYKITTGKKKGALIVRLTSIPTMLKFRIEILKDDGVTQLGYRDAAFNGDTVKFELLTQYEGVYYIRIRNINNLANSFWGNTSSSAYLMTVSLDTLGNEFNDIFGSLSTNPPVPISLNELNPSVIRGKIRGYYYVNNGGNYDFGGLTADQDMFKITTQSQVGVLVMKLVSVPTNLRFRIEVFKDDGISTLGYRDAAINGDTLRFELLTQYAGIYYIRLRNINGSANGINNNSTVPYLLHVALDTTGNEFNDNIASVAKNAPISLSLKETNSTIISDRIRGYYYTNNGGNYDFSNLVADQDFYKITTNNNLGVIVLKLASVPSNLRFRIELIKDDGITQLGYRDATINGDTLRFELLTQYAGVYFVRIRNINGSINGVLNTSSIAYSLNLSLDTVGNEFNDNFSNVSAKVPVNISLNESAPSLLMGKIRGYYYINNGGNYDFTGLAADQDLFKISASKSGVLVMKFSSFPINLRFRIEVLKDDGVTSLGYRDAIISGDTARFELILQTAGIYYIRLRNVNGTANGIGNSSPLPYVLRLSIEISKDELNESIETAYPINANDSVYGKIRGHYRTNFGSVVGADFLALIPDADNYKINTGCYYFKSATLSIVPPNLRMKITAYDTAGNILGSKTASTNGEILTLTSQNLTKANIVKYLEVECATTANDQNTSSRSYLLTTYFRDTIYAPIIAPGIVKPCIDSILTFTSNSIDNNHWSTGETTRTINFLVKKAGIVTLYLFKKGCFSGIDTAFVDMVSPPVANFKVSRNFKNISFTNTSPTATGFKWNFGNGKTSTLPNPIHAYADYQPYTVTLVTTNACGIDSAKRTVLVEELGLNKIETKVGISLYPNPNKGSFKLELSQALTESAKFEIVNTLGQTVLQKDIDVGTIQLDIETELSDGVYFFSLHSLSYNSIQKLVIRKN